MTAGGHGFSRAEELAEISGFSRCSVGLRRNFRERQELQVDIRKLSPEFPWPASAA